MLLLLGKSDRLIEHGVLLVQIFDLRKLLPATPTYDFNIHVRFDHLLDVLEFIDVDIREDFSSCSRFQMQGIQLLTEMA